MTYTCKQFCHFILFRLLIQVSNYVGQVSKEVLTRQNLDKYVYKTEEKKTKTQRGVRYKERLRKKVNGGVSGCCQIHGFDICVLLDSLLTARLSCAQLPLHPPPTSTLALFASPLGHLCKIEKIKKVWERGTEQKIYIFPGHCAVPGMQGQFKDEGEVNVVGRIGELL